MSHLIKLSKTGGRPVHRIYEQQVTTQADIRELNGNLQALVNGANREGRELVIEIWTDYRGESVHETNAQRQFQGSPIAVGHDG